MGSKKYKTYQEISADLEKGRLEQKYFFTGEEDYLKEEIVKRIINLLLPSSLKQFNLDIFYGGSLDIGEFIRQAECLPVFIEKRVVVLKEAEKLKESSRNKLLAYLERPSPATCLIFTTQGRVDSQKEFFKELEASCTTIMFWPLFPNRVREWVREKFQSYHKEIEPEAFSLLYEEVGGRLGDLYNEIEKLVTYTGEKKIITVKEVEEVSSKIKFIQISELSSALIEGDRLNSLTKLRKVLAEGVKPIYILNAVINVLRYIISYNCRSSGFVGKPPFSKELLEKAGNFSLERIKNIYNQLYKIDLGIKSGQLPEETALELLILNFSSS